MEKIKYYINKYKLIIIFILLFLLLLLFCLSETYLNNKEFKNKKEEVIIEEKVEEKVEVEEEKINYKVDIKGEVKKPGVYELDSNSRIIDVIDASGGLTKYANTEYLNLSKKITDEMVIIIYSNNEVEKFKYEDKEVIYIEYECECIDNINDACITEKDTVNTIEESSSIIEEIKESNEETTNEEIKEDETLDNKISINKASKEELMTLSGIGESKALKIIEYREENNGFKNIEEIMKVSGIGESIYSKIKDSIKL